jgi:hypothetical protein
VTISGPVSGGPPYILGAAPTPGYSAYYRLSTVRDAAATLTGGTPTGVGRYTYTATATDKAGNTTANWVTYEVDYRFDGFLQPIIVPITAFKAGSTVPVKFQLKTASGTPVQAGTAPIVSIVPISGSGTPVSGAARWDSLSQQYIYNWQTPKTGAGTIWRITLKLDDPSAHTVDIPLK